MSGDMSSWLNQASTSAQHGPANRPNKQPHTPARRVPPAFLDLTQSDSSPGSPAVSSPGSIIFNSPDRRQLMDFSSRPGPNNPPSQAYHHQHQPLHNRDRDRAQATSNLFIGKRLFQGPRPQHTQTPRVFGEPSAGGGARFVSGFRTGSGLKDRLTTEMNVQAGRIGVPIGIPSNPIPPRSAYKPSYGKLLRWRGLHPRAGRTGHVLIRAGPQHSGPSNLAGGRQ